MQKTVEWKFQRLRSTLEKVKWKHAATGLSKMFPLSQPGTIHCVMTDDREQRTQEYEALLNRTTA